MNRIMDLLEIGVLVLIVAVVLITVVSLKGCPDAGHHAVPQDVGAEGVGPR